LLPDTNLKENIMALSDKLEKGLPIWSRLYKLESMESRMFGLKADMLALMSDVVCEEEIEPLIEFQDYIDAAAERMKWVLSQLRYYAHNERVMPLPPQSDSSSSEATGSRKSQK
jgi:hypothetical protein